MEILFHRPYTLPALLRSDFTKIGEGRSPKRHLSEITRAMKAAAGGKVDGIEGEQDGLRPQAGFMFERALENAWREYHTETRPVELQFTVEHDEIVGTPDGLETLDECILSIKFTWTSMRKWEEDPEGYYMEWFAREKGYLWMMRNGKIRFQDSKSSIRVGPINRVRFIIFWVNGDYTRRPERGVQTTETMFKFSDEELESNWKVLLRYRDWLDKKEIDAKDCISEQ